ncbi:MAG: hypothetical protein ACRC3G_01495 [Bacteroidales bacterium]
MMQLRKTLTGYGCNSKEKIQRLINRIDTQIAKKNKDLSAVKITSSIIVLSPITPKILELVIAKNLNSIPFIVALGVMFVGVLIAGVIVLRAPLESLFYPKRANYQRLKEDLQDLLDFEEEKE